MTDPDADTAQARPVATPHVVVVGGGFSGTAFALHLIRLATRPVDITIVDPRAELGRGVAYSSVDLVHRINIAAVRMSVFEDDRGHFESWAAAHGAQQADPEGLRPNGSFYARRSLFGDYVRSLLDQASAANPAATLRHHVGQALSIRDGTVLTDRDAALPADAVVIATGNPQPELPGPLRALADDPRIVDDVWQPHSLDGVQPSDRVLIVGTGLTMGDAVASLRARGHSGPIVALSRHGLTPLRRKPRPYPVWGDFTTVPSLTARGLLRRIRDAVIEAMREGLAWESVIDAVRLQGQALWGALPDVEKARYLRHLRPYWEIHRFQVAPPVDAALRAAVADGQITIVAASLAGATATADGIDVAWRRRGVARERIERQRFDVVLNCTGPGIGAVLRTNPLLSSLADEGHVEADRLGLGLAVEPDSRVIGSKTAGFPELYALGLLTRGRFGEITGVRELSTQAGSVALSIVRDHRLSDRLPHRGDLLDLQSPLPVPSNPISGKAMLKLYHSTTSPYVRKVMTVAHELGLTDRIELVPAAAHPVERDKTVVAKNPLGKIPTLVTEDGTVLFDSRVIIEYLLGLVPGQTLLPASGAARWTVLTQQALADGLLDAALLIRYENVVRPESIRSAAWLGGQYEKIASALDAIEASALEQTVTVGGIAIAAALGFLDFRFADYDWRTSHPKAARWFESFDSLPSLARTRPFTPAPAPQAASR